MTSEEIREDVLMLLRQLSEDWDCEEEITQDTRLFTDIGLESLDVVVLGTTLQERYGRVFPFPELFAGVGQRKNRDISVGELVAFLDQHMEERDGTRA
ncbi:MAG: acyl carrier protein [Acidobacteriota bacterium]